jgi:hypothetical protein
VKRSAAMIQQHLNRVSSPRETSTSGQQLVCCSSRRTESGYFHGYPTSGRCTTVTSPPWRFTTSRHFLAISSRTRHPSWPDIRLACLVGYDSRGTVCTSVFAVRCNSIAVITAFATEVSIAFCSSVICRGRVSNTHKEPITSPSCAFNGAPA